MTDISKCTLCGLCKSTCPVFKVILKEKQSPRGKVILEKEEQISDDFYVCSVCGACKYTCPNDVEVGVKKARKKLVRDGIETKANKKMIKNVREHGNPFGEVKEGEEPKDLYCC